MSQGVDILKMDASAPPSDSPPSYDPQFEASHRRVGLPGKVFASILCPFIPPITFWRDAARSGQGFGGETHFGPLRPRLMYYPGHPFPIAQEEPPCYIAS